MQVNADKQQQDDVEMLKRCVKIHSVLFAQLDSGAMQGCSLMNHASLSSSLIWVWQMARDLPKVWWRDNCLGLFFRVRVRRLTFSKILLTVSNFLVTVRGPFLFQHGCSPVHKVNSGALIACQEPVAQNTLS